MTPTWWPACKKFLPLNCPCPSGFTWAQRELLSCGSNSSGDNWSFGKQSLERDSTFSGSTAGPSSEGSDHIRVRFNGSTSNHQGYNQNNQNTTGQGGGIECYVGSSGRQLYGCINVIKFSPTQYIFNTNDLLCHTNISNEGAGVFYLSSHLNSIVLDWTAGSDFDGHGGLNYVAYK